MCANMHICSVRFCVCEHNTPSGSDRRTLNHVTHTHTPLARLIVHEIRTFGLQNCTPHTPLSLEKIVSWSLLFRQWLTWFGLLKGASGEGMS